MEARCTSDAHACRALRQLIDFDRTVDTSDKDQAGDEADRTREQEERKGDHGHVAKVQ